MPSNTTTGAVSAALAAAATAAALTVGGGGPSENARAPLPLVPAEMTKAVRDSRRVLHETRSATAPEAVALRAEVERLQQFVTKRLVVCEKVEP